MQDQAGRENKIQKNKKITKKNEKKEKTKKNEKKGAVQASNLKF